MIGKIKEQVFSVYGVAVVGCLAFTLAVISIFITSHNQIVAQRQACERSVKGRQDNRAMWVYLISETNRPSDPKVVAFVEKLNELLPPTHCEGSVPVSNDVIDDIYVSPGSTTSTTATTLATTTTTAAASAPHVVIVQQPAPTPPPNTTTTTTTRSNCIRRTCLPIGTKP